jgi:type II secretion system protein J
MKLDESGLTLLEVLVATAILAVVLAAVYGAYTSHLETIQAVRQSTQVNQIARIILDRMSKDFESAMINPPFPSTELQLGFISEDNNIDGKPADRIDFISLSHLRAGGVGPQTDLCEIGYFLEDDPDREGLNLYRRDDPTLDDDVTEGGITLELAKNVIGLNFFFEDMEGESVEEWNTLEEDSKKTLPTLVTIEIEVLDDIGKGHLFTTSIRPALAEKKEEG